MPRPALWYLQKVELFSAMSEGEMKGVLQGMIDRQYECKHVLYTAHEPVEHTYILKEGEVTLYQTVDGKKVVLDILKPGAIFGNIGFDPESAEKHTAEVSQDSYICTLPRDFFLQLMQKRPDIALRALRILSRRLAQYQSQLQFLSMLGAKERIIAMVHLLNEKEDHSILPTILRVPTKMTHEKLASMTGLTRETVTKQLQKLTEEKLVSIHKKEIRLTEAGKGAVAKLGV